MIFSLSGAIAPPTTPEAEAGGEVRKKKTQAGPSADRPGRGAERASGGVSGTSSFGRHADLLAARSPPRLGFAAVPFARGRRRVERREDLLHVLEALLTRLGQAPLDERREVSWDVRVSLAELRRRREEVRLAELLQRLAQERRFSR